MTDWLTLGSFWVATGAALASMAAVLVSYLAMRSEMDPNVIVYVKHDLSRPSILVIVIENVGRGVAYNVRFDASAPIPEHAFGLEVGSNEPVKHIERGPLASGIPLLAPGDRRVISWGQYGGLFDAIGRDAIRIKASYSRSIKSRRRQSKPFSLEVASFEATDASTPPDVNQVRELERIRTAIEAGQRHLGTVANVLNKPDIEAAIERMRARQQLTSQDTASEQLPGTTDRS